MDANKNTNTEFNPLEALEAMAYSKIDVLLAVSTILLNNVVLAKYVVSNMVTLSDNVVSVVIKAVKGYKKLQVTYISDNLVEVAILKDNGDGHAHDMEPNEDYIADYVDDFFTRRIDMPKKYKLSKFDAEQV